MSFDVLHIVKYRDVYKENNVELEICYCSVWIRLSIPIGTTDHLDIDLASELIQSERGGPDVFIVQ